MRALLLVALPTATAWLGNRFYRSSREDNKQPEDPSPETLHGWRSAAVPLERVDPEAFELFPKEYYGMGQFLLRDVQPEKITALFETDRFLREIEPIVRARVRVARIDHWETKIASNKRRLDGFKSPALAFLEANKLGIKTSLSGSSALGPKREIRWEKVKFDVNFGQIPGLQGWATPQEAAKALKQAQISDDVTVLLACMRNALVDVYEKKLDQGQSSGGRPLSMHRQFLTASKTAQGGILQLRRDLICFQTKVDYVAKSPEYRNATKVANFIVPAVIGRIHFLNSMASRNQATFEAKRFEHPIQASSRWHFMHYEPVGLIQAGVDSLRMKGDEDDDIFTPTRDRLSQEERLARSSLDKLVSDRVAAAPDFVCPQATVLSKNGYREQCVHLGRIHHTIPEALSADEMFALKCAGLFPKQTSVISLKMTQLAGKKNVVKERWVGRICTPQGWTEEIALTDRRGQAAHRLCQQNAERPVPQKQLLDLLMEAMPGRNRHKGRASAH